ncbi:hypothetical protein [Paenibacillus albidus]|uniref:hypothetical protein n=1 Tax=Paenibacillus albidus TaxID=2041023 RepID=UPI001667AD78|nr:hypothetical protein [Paenibacillus albidus]
MRYLSQRSEPYLRSKQGWSFAGLGFRRLKRSQAHSQPAKRAVFAQQTGLELRGLGVSALGARPCAFPACEASRICAANRAGASRAWGFRAWSEAMRLPCLQSELHLRSKQGWSFAGLGVPRLKRSQAPSQPAKRAVFAQQTGLELRGLGVSALEAKPSAFPASEASRICAANRAGASRAWGFGA